LTSTAAWSRAVTVVGATPASGSQVWSGTVADLLNMPKRMSSTALPGITAPRIVVRSKEPVLL